MMRVNESLLRDLLRLFVWFPVKWIVSLLPMDSFFEVIKFMGICHFRFDRRKRRKLANRISEILNISKFQAFEATKKYYENHYVDRLHIFLYPRLKLGETAREFIRFENIELLKKIIAKHNGVLIVQPHFGPVQLTLLQLALEGYQPLQIGFPTDNGLSRIGRLVAFKYRLKYEKILPAPIIAADHFLGKAYRHLIHGGIVLTTGDGAGGGTYLGEHKKLTILGRKRRVPLGPASLAIKTRALYLPTFIIPEGHNCFKIVFEGPLLPKYHDLAKDKIYITEKFLGVTERYIRAYPHCWHFWDEIQDHQ